MPWFRVDDDLAVHAKVVAAGNAAMGLWVRAGSWSSQQLTEGKVPQHMIGALGGTQAHARRLVDAGLWVEMDGGYAFHEWATRQPSAAEVRARDAARHEARAAAGRVGGIASGVARRKHSQSTDEAEPKQTRSTDEANAKQNEAPARPVPKEQLPPTTSVAEIAPTQRVIASYVEAVQEAGAVLDKRAKGRIAKETPELLAAGADLDLLCEAARRLAVNGYADLGAEARRLWAERNHRPRSTTDQRVAQGLALVAHFTEKEAGA